MCGATRTPADHEYDNACDADCNECGATRTPAAHVYDNACDADCNECGATRIPSAHDYTNACDADCNECGAEREVGDHVYDNACDTTCNECGDTRTITHSWSKWTETKAPSCIKTGTEQRECSVCHTTETKTVNALNHIDENKDNICDREECKAVLCGEGNHVEDNGTVTTPATCVATGVKTFTCTACGNTLRTEEIAIDTTNHDLEEHEAQAPTCTEIGWNAYETCKREGCGYTTKVKIEATGHGADKYMVINGVLYYGAACQCEDQIAIIEEGTTVEISNEADLKTVLTAGYSIKLTADVDLTSVIKLENGQKVTIDLAGKTITADWKDENGVVDVLWACGEGIEVTITGNGTMACGKDGSKVCVISATDGAKITIENGTFTSGGSACIYATREGVIIINGGTFSADQYYLGNRYLLDVNENDTTLGTIIVKGGSFKDFDPANHTNDGAYTNKVANGYHSIKDGDNYVVNKCTEDEENQENVVPATCTKEGSYNLVVRCTECNAILSSEAKTTQKTEHTYSEAFTTDVAATCTTEGSKSRHCTGTDCDAKTDVTVIDATGHSLTWVETTAPTCTEEGVETGSCANCTHTETRPVDATGHTYVDGTCKCGATDPNYGGETPDTPTSNRYYIATIRSSGNYWYMTSDLGTADTKRYQAVDSGLTTLPATINNPESGYVFVLIDNGDGTYSVQAEGVDGDNYLGWTSGNSGTLVAKENALDLTVEVTNGVYNIHFTASDAERYLALNQNTGTNYFAWYKSGQKQDLILIPVVENGESGGDTTCEHTNTTETTTATCTAAGTTTVTCDDCKEVVSTAETAALGHKYVDGTCSVCGGEDPDYEGGNQGGSTESAWTLVTDASTLQVGDSIVIVAKDSNVALSTTQNGNNRGQVAVTKDNDTVTLGDGIQILTLHAGTETGTFAFYAGSGYLYAASSSKNYLRTETTLSANSSWSITIEADGTATIIAQGSNTRNWLRYNSSNSIFSCYSSGQGDVEIYKLVNNSNN